MITFAFGLVHGFGFSFALRQTLQFAGSHLLTSLLSFNIGVELGQLLALTVMLGLILWWRRSPGFARRAVLANALILFAGFLLMDYQLAGFLTQKAA